MRNSFTHTLHIRTLHCYPSYEESFDSYPSFTHTLHSYPSYEEPFHSYPSYKDPSPLPITWGTLIHMHRRRNIHSDPPREEAPSIHWNMFQEYGRVCCRICTGVSYSHDNKQPPLATWRHIDLSGKWQASKSECATMAISAMEIALQQITLCNTTCSSKGCVEMLL